MSFGARYFFMVINGGDDLQEEVENRTVNLAASTTKLTARTLVRGIRWYLMHRGQKRLRKQMQQPHKEGKQSVNDLWRNCSGTRMGTVSHID